MTKNKRFHLNLWDAKKGVVFVTANAAYQITIISNVKHSFIFLMDIPALVLIKRIK